MRMSEKPIVFSATAFIASSRATRSNAVESRAGRSMTFVAPMSSVKTTSIQVPTMPNASAAPTENDTTAASTWLACSSRRRGKRSAATPESGASRNIGMARTPSTVPTSAPEPVTSYTTQPSAACWIHWLAQERSELVQSRRNCGYASAEARSAPRNRRAGSRERRVVAGHHAHIDDAHRAVPHLGDGALDRGLQLGELAHRPDAERALRAGHHGDVDVGIVDALADPLVLDGTAALLRHALLVELVVVERAVVGDQEKARQLVVRGGPERRVAHEEITVSHDADHQAPAAVQCECRADREAGAGPDAATAIGAEIVERVAEVPIRAVPAERQLRQAYVQAGGRFIECTRQRADGNRAVRFLARLGARLHGGGPRAHRLEKERYGNVRLAHQVYVRGRQAL